MTPESKELGRALSALRETRIPAPGYRAIAAGVGQPPTTVHAMITGKIVSTWPRTKDVIIHLGGDPASVEALWEAAARAAVRRRNEGPSYVSQVATTANALTTIINRKPLPVTLLAALPPATAALLATVAEMTGTVLEIGCAEEWQLRAKVADRP